MCSSDLELAAQSISGPPAARAGVVRALIAIAQQAEEHRPACLERFMTFLNDQDAEVLRAASRILGTESLLAAPEAPDFLAQFATSAAFRNDPSTFFLRLLDHDGSMQPFEKAILEAIDNFVVAMADGAGASVNRQIGRAHV